MNDGKFGCLLDVKTIKKMSVKTLRMIYDIGLTTVTI